MLSEIMRREDEVAVKRARVYRAIANNLRDFGYDGISVNMIREIHEAMEAGADLPYGIIGMFARGQLDEADFEKGTTS